MLYVCTEAEDEQKQLQLEFGIKNNYYLVPLKQSYFLSEMLTSISHQFFQTKVPTLVEKIKELIVFSFNKIYSLTSYRDLMRLIQKQQNDIQMYREHLIEMNRAFAEDNLDLDLSKQDDPSENNDFLFQEALKGETHQPENLDLLQLPLASELNFQLENSDAKTEKTMQSDLWGRSSQKEIQKIIGFTNIDNVFSSSGEASFQNWKSDREEKTKVESSQNVDKEEKERSGSQEMSSFKRKGSTIYVSNKNLRQIFVSEIKYDLNREIKLGSAIFDSQSGAQPEKMNPQKKIRNALMNCKLKHRRK